MKFELQLVITEECNLSCQYCYMHQNPRSMPIKIFDKLYAKLPEILKLHNCDTFNVVYFGGEPLLNWELIEYSLPLFDKNPYKPFSSVIITNGLLLNEGHLDFVKKSKTGRFSFSYDGIWQNENRPCKNGKSAQPVYDKLIRTAFREFAGGFKTMVGPNNVSTLYENYRYCVDNDVRFIDFTLVRDNIWSNQSIQQYDENLKKVIDDYIKLIQAGDRRTFSLVFLYLSFILNHPLTGKPTSGCYAGHGGMAFMPNGDGYPCARFGTNKTLKLYDFANDEFIEENFLKLSNNLINIHTYERCKKCIAFDICKAGCLYSQLKTDGERYWGEPIEDVCKITKITFRECYRFFEEVKNTKSFTEWILPTLLQIKN